MYDVLNPIVPLPNAGTNSQPKNKQKAVKTDSCSTDTHDVATTVLAGRSCSKLPTASVSFLAKRNKLRSRFKEADRMIAIRTATG